MYCYRIFLQKSDTILTFVKVRAPVLVYDVCRFTINHKTPTNRLASLLSFSLFCLNFSPTNVSYLFFPSSTYRKQTKQSWERCTCVGGCDCVWGGFYPQITVTAHTVTGECVQLSENRFLAFWCGRSQNGRPLNTRNAWRDQGCSSPNKLPAGSQLAASRTRSGRRHRLLCLRRRLLRWSPSFSLCAPFWGRLLNAVLGENLGDPGAKPTELRLHVLSTAPELALNA